MLIRLYIASRIDIFWSIVDADKKSRTDQKPRPLAWQNRNVESLMIYAPWVDDRSSIYANISDVLPHQLEKIGYKIAFGYSLKDCFPGNVTLKLSNFTGDKLGDYIPNINSMLIVSDKLKKVLIATGESFEFYEVMIKDKKNKILKNHYYLAQLVGSLSCIDREKSDFDISHMKEGQILTFRRLVLDHSKIPKDKHIFRLGEMRQLIIVSKDLAYKIYRVHNCRGMIFQIMEEYGAEFRE